MNVKLVFVLLLLQICRSFGQVFELENVPLRAPAFCNVLTHKGPCRATINRFRYNAEIGNCERFTYGGCPGLTGIKNMFSTLQDCMNVCHRTLDENRGLNSEDQECSLEINLGRECQLDPNSYDITDCPGLGENPSKDKCESLGCCWYPNINICYQRQNVLANATCSVSYNTEDGFQGKVVFQANTKRFSGWTGILTFKQRVTNDLCIFKDQFGPELRITENLGNGKHFVVRGLTPICNGENIVIPFAGSYRSSTFSNTLCQSLNMV